MENKLVRNKAKIGRKIYHLDGNDKEVCAKMEAMSYKRELEWLKEKQEKNYDEEVRIVKVLPSRKDDAFEWVEVNGRLGIRMKSHYIPLHCEYCGSRNISDYSCNQCGAPT